MRRREGQPRGQLRLFGRPLGEGDLHTGQYFLDWLPFREEAERLPGFRASGYQQGCIVRLAARDRLVAQKGQLPAGGIPPKEAPHIHGRDGTSWGRGEIMEYQFMAMLIAHQETQLVPLQRPVKVSVSMRS